MIKFWNDFYSNQQTSADQEWILQDSQHLVEHIRSVIAHSEDRYKTINILEIGCGTSSLSKSFLQNFISMRQPENRQRCHIVATDVSEDCIRYNQERDVDYIHSLLATPHCTDNHLESIRQGIATFDSLLYETLDVLSEASIDAFHSKLKLQFHEHGFLPNIIMDKGCLDTFLFRGEKHSNKSSRYPPLLLSLLNNVHSLLADNGQYIIISPRSKIKAVRDFSGFSMVSIHKLDPQAIGKGKLDGKLKDDGTAHSFVHVCHRHNSYKVSFHEPFKDENSFQIVDDNDICPSCFITFSEYRCGDDVIRRGPCYWSRRWKGHCIHCNRTKILQSPSHTVSDKGK